MKSGVIPDGKPLEGEKVEIGGDSPGGSRSSSDEATGAEREKIESLGQ